MNTINEIDTIMRKTEELHPDLLMYYTNEDGFPMVRHPLCFSVPHSQQMNALVNRTYEQKRQRSMDALGQNKFSTYVWLHERPYRLDALMEIDLDYITTSELAKIAGQVWIDSENIWQNMDKWDELFTILGDTSQDAMSDSEHTTINLLPDEFPIFRGFNDSGTCRGYSWTLDEAKAEWFSTRLLPPGGNACVAGAMVSKSDVVWYLEGRGEKEIVVRNPNKLDISTECWSKEV